MKYLIRDANRKELELDEDTNIIINNNVGMYQYNNKIAIMCNDLNNNTHDDNIYMIRN